MTIDKKKVSCNISAVKEKKLTEGRIMAEGCLLQGLLEKRQNKK